MLQNGSFKSAALLFEISSGLRKDKSLLISFMHTMIIQQDPIKKLMSGMNVRIPIICTVDSAKKGNA